MNQKEIIEKACEAYMNRDWSEFERLGQLLDEAGKVALGKALFVP